MLLAVFAGITEGCGVIWSMVGSGGIGSDAGSIGLFTSKREVCLKLSHVTKGSPKPLANKFS